MRFSAEALAAWFVDYYVHIKNAEIERFQGRTEHRDIQMF